MDTTDRPAYVIPAQVLHREVDGEMVLLDLETERYFGLNAVGAEIVARITAEPWDEAFATLSAYYEVDPSVLERDIHELVAALVERGLLHPSEASG